MTWDDKIELVKLLNNEKYEEAVEFFGKEQDWDEQAVIMFVTGFDLSKYELLLPIKERIEKETSPDMMTAMRLSFMCEMLSEKNEDERI